MCFREQDWSGEDGYCCCFFIDPLAILGQGWPEAFAWCESQFGPGRDLGPIQDFDGVRWFFVPNIAMGFHNADDAFAFKMRWGGAATHD